MRDKQQSHFNPTLPFKSVAIALLFSVFLGPVGLLYASVLGGVILLVLCFISVSCKLFVAAIVFWLASCVWSVIAVNRYNNKMLMKYPAQ